VELTPRPLGDEGQCDELFLCGRPGSP